MHIKTPSNIIYSFILLNYIVTSFQVIQNNENLMQGHETMPNQTIDIKISEPQKIRQGWYKVLCYKIDVTILEDGQLCPKGS